MKVLQEIKEIVSLIESSEEYCKKNEGAIFKQRVAYLFISGVKGLLEAYKEGADLEESVSLFLELIHARDSVKDRF